MICAARESGAKRTEKGIAGESRCRKAKGSKRKFFRMAAGFLMQLLHSSLLLLKEGFS